MKKFPQILINHKNNSKKNPLDDYPLTNIQHMVLFLALNNYSYSEIALLLTLTKLVVKKL